MLLASINLPPVWRMLIPSGFPFTHLSAHLSIRTSVSTLTLHAASVWHCAIHLQVADIGTEDLPPVEGLASGSVPRCRRQRALDLRGCGRAMVAAKVVVVAAAFSLQPGWIISVWTAVVPRGRCWRPPIYRALFSSL